MRNILIDINGNTKLSIAAQCQSRKWEREREYRMLCLGKKRGNYQDKYFLTCPVNCHVAKYHKHEICK